MIESAAHLVDHVVPYQPIRQWVLTFPNPLRFLFAVRPQVVSQVLGVVYRAISTYLIKKTGFTVASGARTGAVRVNLARHATGFFPARRNPLRGQPA